MPRPSTKVAGEGTTATRGAPQKASKANKESKATQKQLAPKSTARPTHSRRRVLVVSITHDSQYPVICANRLLSSMIQPRAVKKLIFLILARQTMPHRSRRGTNLSPTKSTLCSTPLLVCVPRSPMSRTSLIGLLTSHTFSKWLERERIRREYATYAGKSCITCQQASTNSSVLVTNMAIRKFRLGCEIISTSSPLHHQIVAVTSSNATQRFTTRPLSRNVGPIPSQPTSPGLRLLSVNYARVRFQSLPYNPLSTTSFALSSLTIR